MNNSVPTVDLIKADLIRSGFRPSTPVSHVALTVETSIINTSNFQGYAAVCSNMLFLFRDTFPFSNYSHFATLNLRETTCLKSGVKLILRMPYVKLKNGKHTIEICGLTQEMVDLIRGQCR